jgi:hypothetical protein
MNIMQQHKQLGGRFQPYGMYNLKNLEVCKFMEITKGSSSLGFLKNFLMVLNMSVNGAIHECPYQVL